MPPQASQSNPAQAAEDSVKAFMSLDEGGQSKALAKMSQEAKNSLLLGVRALKSFEPQQAPQKEDEGMLKGFADRVVGTFKGIKQMVMPSEQEDVEAIKAHAPSRIGETYREGGRQVKEQASKSLQSFKAGLPVEGTLGAARTATTAASLANPLATGSVVDINRMQDEGRMKEAIGAGAFDVLALWGGRGNKSLDPRPWAEENTWQMRRGPSTGQKISKLTSAIGETGETVKNVERTLPEIEQTAKQLGKPKSIGDFATNVRTSLSRLQSEFNSVFDPVKNRRAYTPAIKNHIDRILRENPNLMKTPEGREEVAALRRIQHQYDKPWTLEDMNLERSRLRKQMRSLYDAKPTDAAAKMKLDAELRAKKVVADSFSETVNDHLTHITGKPQGYYDILRQKQEALMDLNDHLDSQVEKLRDKQAAREGRTLGERLKPHAYMSSGGPRVHVPFGEAVPAEGASDVASRKVRQAFGPSKTKRVGRAAVLALPVSHLATAGQDAKASRMTPPPSPDE